MPITLQKIDTLRSLIKSLRDTGFSERWPPEYLRLYILWGYFNQIYNLLYDHGRDWDRIACFAIDKRFSPIVENYMLKCEATKQLAMQPCVGDGRKGFRPNKHVRIAFKTLRDIFGISINEVCMRSDGICGERRGKGWQLCLNYQWPDLPQNGVNFSDVEFTLVGAVLTIAYQVRNNLFHGSKLSMSDRDKLLVKLIGDIMESILKAIDEALVIE